MMETYYLTCASVFLYFLLITPKECYAALSSVSLTFSPATVCIDLELSISFTTDRPLTTSDPINLILPGFTRGECDNSEGQDITDPTTAPVSLPSVWEMEWTEGTVSNSFWDSSLQLTPKSTIAASTAVAIIIDRSNGIRANCPSTNTVSSPDYVITDVMEPSSVTISSVDRTAITGSCYFTDTLLSVETELPKRPMDIVISFRPAMTVAATETVTIVMPGFTNSDFSGSNPTPAVGQGGVSTAVSLDAASAVLFSAYWTEGSYVQGSSGFLASQLELTVQAGQSLTPGTLYEVEIDGYTNKIGAQCGIAANHTAITISSNAALGSVAATALLSTPAIGNGCRHLHNCTDNGVCDVCQESCICARGHGDATDIHQGGPPPNPDCSSRICPSSYSWSSLPSSSSSSHILGECSNAGICNRTVGLCDCFAGFEGNACQRRACPASVDGKICSGRGKCLSQRQLSVRLDAFPLSDPLDFYNTGERYSLYGTENGEGGAWDQDYLYRCHCDSSWTVGLRSGEVQVAEYFGNACEFRRCPSGDDPFTLLDETDCESTIAEGGRGTGEPGNLCHVDCSNRGICDYTTGVCFCFAGFGGIACDMIL